MRKVQAPSFSQPCFRFPGRTYPASIRQQAVDLDFSARAKVDFPVGDRWHRKLNGVSGRNPSVLRAVPQLRSEIARIVSMQNGRRTPRGGIRAELTVVKRPNNTVASRARGRDRWRRSREAIA